MRLRRLLLENIRSYENEEVFFEDGITLLAGDIGSGKTTLLIAIEFALFGIRRGEVSGDALLRHGASSASVELECIINDYRVCISRSLKRTSSGVRQEEGFCEIDGVREVLTAQELKARVLSLLGYPDELVSKGKGLIYRYTVYTPQEEMKRILLDSDSHRLDTLRAAFGFDKYKTVLSNSQLVLRYVREQERFVEGQLKTLSDQDLHEETIQTSLDDSAKELQLVSLEVGKISDRVNNEKKSLSSLQEKYDLFLSKQRVREQHLARLKALGEEAQRIQVVLSSDPPNVPEKVEDPSSARQKVLALRDSYLTKQAQARQRLAQAQSILDECAQFVRDINSLSVCPTCKQDVGADHKQHLHDVQEKKVLQATQDKTQALQDIEKCSSALSRIAQKQEELVKRQQEFQLFVLAQQKVASFHASLSTHRKRLDEINNEISELNENIPSKESFDDALLKKQRDRVEQVQSQLSSLRVQHATLEAKHSQCASQLAQARKLAEKKQLLEKSASDLASTRSWLNQLFNPLVGQIEQQVLAAIHAEFSARFTDWFTRLIEDDSMFAFLSDSFAPSVTQDGYDVDTQYLSGGEKTAVALAYRLALTTVLNAQVRSLHTNDVLILDEPTDGFSSQQLDRVRDVLLQLPMKQILLVSHEPKMASFADHVLMVNKVGQLSSVNS